MPTPGEIRNWATGLEPGTIFTLDDAQQACPTKSRAAIKSTLSRLCRGDDPLLARAVRGLYSRRLVGSMIPTRLEPQVYVELPWRIAGPGAGLASLNAVNSLCWSTQVPAKLCIAVVGRPPTPPDRTTKYVQRSNRKRVMLTPIEVSLLEAVASFDDFAEMDWDEAVDRLASILSRRQRNLGARPDLVNYVASHEAYRGERFVRRCDELGKVCGT